MKYFCLAIFSLLAQENVRAETKVSLAQCYIKSAGKGSCEGKVQHPFVVNQDAPWELTLLSNMGASLARLDKKNFSFLPTSFTVGFALREKPARFRLIGFSCTQDKKQCFREKIEEKIDYAKYQNE